MARILIADDEVNVRLTLREMLRREGYEIVEAKDGQDAVEKARLENFDVVILDIKMPRMDGLEALRIITEEKPSSVCLMVTAFGSAKVGREAIQIGAYDFFHKPFEMEELKIVVRRATERAQLQQKIHDLKKQLQPKPVFQKIVGNSPKMEQLFDLIKRIAESEVSVLVMGESGTGKELVGQAIHDLSSRRNQPFIKINCAAIPEQLLESELFGHEKGSFTGATQKKLGMFELAHNGTLLLDEIGEIPLSLQPKLLRALQEREIQRVGGTEIIKINIRLIAATNRNLAEQVAAKKFREDLYYRLNVLPLQIPALRERDGDIPQLIEHFIEHYSRSINKHVTSVEPEALEIMLNYNWPGNVRELENAIQRGVVLTQTDQIEKENLPQSVLECINQFHTPLPEDMVVDQDFDFTRPMSEIIDSNSSKIEVRLINMALMKADNKRQEAADLLGISRKSLHNKMLKYELF